MDEAANPEPNVELELARSRLRDLIEWRDFIAKELSFTDAEIARDARAFANLTGDYVKPSLDQLRRILFDDRLAPGSRTR
jgi:hypothetical protein